MLNDKNDDIIIIGAGVFGLSTALYLARDGYSHITVFDSKPYDKILYNQDNGCDAASADINKIFRASYGNKVHYQKLAYYARDEWLAWNQRISSTPSSDLPKGLSPTDRLYTESSLLRLPGSQDDPLSVSEQEGLLTLSPSDRSRNYIIDDPEELARAREDGFGSLVQNVIETTEWKGTGVLDATAGYLRADKACIWMAHLVRNAGVRFIEGETTGRVVELLQEGNTITGVRTGDGKVHKAVLTIIAGGGWTPSLVPWARDLLETTAGSVVSLKIPSHRPDLLHKFSEDHWPVITREVSIAGSNGGENHMGILYSLPHINGVIKVGYRVTKFTNYTTVSDGARVSTPITAYTSPAQETNVPLVAINAIKDYVRQHMPQLAPYGISYTRLCWYTDSIDNDFLIDYVPGLNKSLFVASGGSGHGFKFAPVLGAHVLDALNTRVSEFTELWKWRAVPEGKRNGLEEREGGPRVLAKQHMATPDDWTF